MAQVFTVSNVAELNDAIRAAEGGDTIKLEAGEYGELNINSKHFDGDGLTITSEDSDNFAVFDQILLYRAENIHFDQIEIDYDPMETEGYKVGFRAAEGEDISITNSVLSGGPDLDRPNPDYVNSPVGIGVQIQRVDNVVIDNNDISDFHVGIGFAYIDGLQVNNNHISDMRTSPLTGGATSNAEITGNHFESSHPVALGGSGDHGDMVHFYPLTHQDGPMENIVIRDNFFEQGTGEDAILGIYIDDAGSGGSGLGYTNVVIENNIIHNGDAQAIRIENADGVSIVDNSLIQSDGSGMGEAPGVVLTSGTRNVVIDNNIVAGVITGSSTGPNNAAVLNVDIGDNLFIQDRDPFGENYAGDLFRNGVTPNGDVDDFIPLDGSVAEGYGATLVSFDPENPQHQALVTATRAGHLDIQTVNFDLEAVFDPDGEVDLTGAQVSWDFGDGNSASGDDIDHTYETAGTYEVTAEIRLANGHLFTDTHTVDVFTVDAVTMDFENGIEDTSDIENRVTINGDVRLEAGRFGDAVRLVDGTSQVSVRRSEEILDNPEFTISFAFQKDGGTDTNSDNGMMVYFSGTSYISTNEGGIRFGGTTSTGRTIQLEVEDDSIEDGGWNHVTYTYSSETGTATLYLNGQEVDSLTGLTGIQHTTGGHNLLLGGRVGGAFGGLMDEVEFTRVALTADEVQTRYETLFDFEPTPAAEGGDVVVETPVEVVDQEPESDVAPAPAPLPEEEPDLVVSTPIPEPETEPSVDPIVTPELVGGGRRFGLLTLEEEEELHGGIVPRADDDDGRVRYLDPAPAPQPVTTPVMPPTLNPAVARGDEDEPMVTPTTTPYPRPQIDPLPDADDEDSDVEDESLFQVFVDALVAEYFPFLDGTMGGNGAIPDDQIFYEEEDEEDDDTGRHVSLFDLLPSTGHMTEEAAEAASDDDEDAEGREPADMWL